MMLSDPKPVVAKALGELREFDRIANGLRFTLSGRDWR
jgi:hypothetical protein